MERHFKQLLPLDLRVIAGCVPLRKLLRLTCVFRPAVFVILRHYAGLGFQSLETFSHDLPFPPIPLEAALGGAIQRLRHVTGDDFAALCKQIRLGPGQTVRLLEVMPTVLEWREMRRVSVCRLLCLFERSRKPRPPRHSGAAGQLGALNDSQGYHGDRRCRNRGSAKMPFKPAIGHPGTLVYCLRVIRREL